MNLEMAGVVGFEPTNAGIKTRCLNHLATPQCEISIFTDSLCLLKNSSTTTIKQRMNIQAFGDKTISVFRPLRQYFYTTCFIRNW